MKNLSSIIVVALVINFASMPSACSRDISQLSPEMQRRYYALRREAKREGINFKAICTFRPQEEQDRNYAKGRTEPGKKITWTRRSKHTERIAFDIAVIKNDRISWEPEDYYPFGAIAARVGLIWGGNWKVRDYGHFEISR